MIPLDAALQLAGRGCGHADGFPPTEFVSPTDFYENCCDEEANTYRAMLMSSEGSTDVSLTKEEYELPRTQRMQERASEMRSTLPFTHVVYGPWTGNKKSLIEQLVCTGYDPKMRGIPSRSRILQRNGKMYIGTFGDDDIEIKSYKESLHLYGKKMASESTLRNKAPAARFFPVLGGDEGDIQWIAVVDVTTHWVADLYRDPV
jgi:hypothetical protein